MLDGVDIGDTILRRCGHVSEVLQALLFAQLLDQCTVLVGPLESHAEGDHSVVVLQLGEIRDSCEAHILLVGCSRHTRGYEVWHIDQCDSHWLRPQEIGAEDDDAQQ